MSIGKDSGLLQVDALTRRRGTIPALTGIRFLAAFYVVLFHSLPWLNAHFQLPSPVLRFLGNGYLAVGLFFLLSGFILAYTYDQQIEGAPNRIRFWEARFARIYPVYLLSLAMAYPFERGLGFATQISVLGMVQAWNPRMPEIAGAWNYPAWSLSVEAFFYICFPIILPWISRMDAKKRHWFVGLLLAICVLGRTPVRGLGTWDRFSVFTRFVPLPILRIPEFLLGAVLGIAFLRSDGQRTHTFRAYSAFVAMLVVLSLPIGPWVSFVMVPFAVLVYELAEGGSGIARFLSSRSMVLLGGASYSVYLLQFPVRSWVRILFSRMSGRLENLGSALTPLILVIFSVLIFIYWEEPARKLLRRGFAGARNQQARVESDKFSAKNN